MQKPQAGKSTNPRIEHVVVLMLENRSFDHMVGYLKSLNPEVDGVTGRETCPNDPLKPREGSTKVSDDAPYVALVDPSHSYAATKKQCFGYGPVKAPAPMTGFVRNYAENDDFVVGADIMSCFNPKTLPTLNTLANEFAIFDHWHSSLPGPTQPNRMFLHSATSHGLTANNVAELTEGMPQKTIFDSLNEAGLDWRVYFHDLPSVLLMRNMRDLKYVGKINYFDFFYEAAASGDLPPYTFLDPRWFTFFEWEASDQHPPHDVRPGEYLVAKIYQALRNGPKWNSTLFIVTYDEHGGYWDHVPTPFGAPRPDDVPNDEGFEFNRLGVRVPTIMASPWINKGTVIHAPPQAHYEHSSVPATLKKLFNLPHFLTRRDAWAATFDHVVNQRDTPRTDCPTSLPVPGPKALHEQWEKFSGSAISPSETAAGGVEQSTSTMSKDPITDLQREWTAIARGLDDQSSTEGWLSALQEQMLQNEHQAAIFVQQQVRKFFERQKHQLLALKAQADTTSKQQ